MGKFRPTLLGTSWATLTPNAASCLRLVRALCAQTHEAWLEDKRYINMSLLYEERKEQLRRAA